MKRRKGKNGLRLEGSESKSSNNGVEWEQRECMYGTRESESMGKAKKGQRAYVARSVW